MIQIVAGTYGKAEGNRVVAVTAANGPFTLQPEQEARLVALGVAEYVDKPAQTACRAPAMPLNNIPKYNAEMKMDELRAIAKQMGLSFKPGMTKVEMVQEMDNCLSGSMEPGAEENNGL